MPLTALLSRAPLKRRRSFSVAPGCTLASDHAVPLGLVGFITLALGGCAAVVQAPAAPLSAEVPASWAQSAPGVRTQAAASLSPGWWQTLADAKLDALMTQALARNTDLAAARAALAQAEALADAREAALGPNLSLSGSAQRSKNGSASAANSYGVSLNGGFNPDLFGGNAAAARAAAADAQAAWASLAGTRLAISTSVALNYLDLRSQQARLAIAERNLQAQQDTQRITAWRVQAGLASSLDLAQATQNVAQTAATVASLGTAIGQDLHALAVLCGEPPAALRERLGVAAPLPQWPTAQTLALPAEVLRQRPDVRAAESRVQAALARLDQAAAARWPSFSLSATLGLRALTLGGLLDGSVANTLLASLSVPLFDGGALAAQQRAQAAALEQARAQWLGTVLAALKDVENALLALRQDGERLQHLQTAATAARDAELIAQQRYRSGLVDFRTVLDAQRARLLTEDAVQVQQATLAADGVRLAQALGGGVLADPPQASPVSSAVIAPLVPSTP